MDNKILITGAAGFIGFNLANHLLDEGTEVIGVDSINTAYDIKFKEFRLSKLNDLNNFNFYNIDLSDPILLNETLKNYKFDVIFHLAARAGVRQSFQDPLSYIKDNTIATVNVANFCKEKNIERLILASTSSIYGDSGNKEMEENLDEKISPPSVYASTKLSGEVLANTILSDSNTKTVITRFFTVFGPYGRPDMSILRFIHWIAEKKDVIIFGDGEQRRSFTYIDDVINHLMLSKNLNNNQTLNVGNNQTESLNNIISMIESALDIKANIINKERAFRDPDVVLPSLNKSKNILNWEPSTTIKNGIQFTVDWYLKNREYLKDCKYI